MNISFQEQCRLDGVAPADCSLMDKILDDFKSVDLFWMAMVFVAFTISNISRVIRWGMLVKNLGYPVRNSRLFMSILIGYLFNLLFPRLGEVVRAGTVARTENIPMEKVVGTIVVDRIMDVIALAMVLGSAFLLEYDTLSNFLAENKTESDGGSGFYKLGLLLLAGVAGIFLFNKYKHRFAEFNIAKKFIKFFDGILDGLKTVGKLKQPGWFIFHSIIVWAMYFFMTYFCFFAFEPTAQLSPKIGWIVFAFAGLGVLIPSPGGMGTVHWLTIRALAIYGINEIEGFSFANILFFGIQIFYVIIGGIISLLILIYFDNLINKKSPEVDEA